MGYSINLSCIQSIYPSKKSIFFSLGFNVHCTLQSKMYILYVHWYRAKFVRKVLMSFFLNFDIPKIPIEHKQMKF